MDLDERNGHGSLFDDARWLLKTSFRKLMTWVTKLDYISLAEHAFSKKEKKIMHYWIRASAADFDGPLPQPRRQFAISFFCFHHYDRHSSVSLICFWMINSGHTAVNIGNSKIVIFGGLLDKRFLGDVVVYDTGTIFFFLNYILSSFEIFMYVSMWVRCNDSEVVQYHDLLLIICIEFAIRWFRNLFG